MSPTPRSDWDTPANGDFASYVERLGRAQALRTAAQPHQQVDLPQLPSAIANSAAPTAATAAASATTAALPAPPSPGQVARAAAPNLADKLRAVRIVVFLVFTAQALVLWLLHKGSLPLLFFTGVVWFFLGRAQSTLQRTLAPVDSSERGTHLQRLRDELQRTARARAATHSTQKSKKK